MIIKRKEFKEMILEDSRKDYFESLQDIVLKSIEDSYMSFCKCETEYMLQFYYGELAGMLFVASNCNYIDTDEFLKLSEMIQLKHTELSRNINKNKEY